MVSTNDHPEQSTTDIDMKGVRVLVVDDEQSVLASTSRVLSAAGAEVVQACGGRQAIAALASQPFDVVLSDIAMPDASGIDVLRAVRERDLDAAVLLLTGLPNVQTAVDALHLGALDYLTKPQSTASLRKAVARAANVARLARTKREAQATIGREPTAAGDRAALGLAFDRALSTLWMAFQPIVQRDGSVFGHEALMRTRESSLPHPGAVLDAADRLGRMQEVGRRTRGLVVSRLPEVPDGVAVFLNLHASDLADPMLVGEDAPIATMAHRIVLEVTERASLDGLKDPRAIVAGLRARGFRIAIDDLGAGYAGLTAFTQLEPEVAKLDMSLVRDVDKDGRKARIIQAMTSLCHDLGALVVAEGVETIGERDTLLGLGCDLFQGYLIAKPAYPIPAVMWPPSAGLA